MQITSQCLSKCQRVCNHAIRDNRPQCGRCADKLCQTCPIVVIGEERRAKSNCAYIKIQIYPKKALASNKIDRFLTEVPKQVVDLILFPFLFFRKCEDPNNRLRFYRHYYVLSGKWLEDSFARGTRATRVIFCSLTSVYYTRSVYRVFENTRYL